MKSHKKVLYLNQLLKEMKVEETIFPNATSNMGVSTLSHEKDAYEVVQELAAFTFEDRNELVYFLNDLPHLNGLEMLMLLNPFPQNNIKLN